MRYLATFLLFSFSMFTICAQSSIVIERTARAANPTLVYQGVEGDAELSAKVRTTLLNCGWFDVKRGGTTDYVIKGHGTPENLTLRVENSEGAEAATVQVSGKNVTDAAHAGVDAVLKALFNIPGICRSRIVFTADTGKGNRELVVCDFDGQNSKVITNNRTLSMDPVWAPDGKSIIYSHFGKGSTSLVQYDLASGLSRRLSRYNGLNAGGAISPNGKYVAMVLNRDNQVDLFVREVEGKELKRLTNDKSVEASPCWSPDGKTLCFVSDAAGRPLLYTVNPFENIRPQRIAGLSGSERVTPCWGRDGKLTYSAKVGRDYIVAVAQIRGDRGIMENVGPEGTSVPGEGPSWAPDGRHVAVEYGGKIYIVDTWLGRRRSLFTGSTKLGQPDWSPLMTE